MNLSMMVWLNHLIMESWMLQYQVCPSILAADFMAFGQDIHALQAAGCTHLHLDIMDGSFVPQITYGEKVISGARRLFRGTMDTHLMIVHPERHYPVFAACGADIITFHAEAVDHIPKHIALIRATGKKAGIAIDTPTLDLCEIEANLDDLEVVLVATGKVGESGRPLDPAQFDKVRALRKMGGDRLNIMVDIGITEETIVAARAAGANWFVVSSAIFKSPLGIGEAFKQLSNMII